MPTRFSRNYGSSGPTRDEQNLNKLRQFEAAESRAAQSDVALGRLGLAQDKLAFEQGMKIAEADRKAQESAARMTAAQERSAILEQQLQLQKDAQEIRARKEELQQMDSTRKASDIKGFLEATRGLKEDQNDFETVVEDAMIKYPNALQDEFIQKRMGWLTTSRDEFRKRTRLTEKATEAGMKRTKVTVDGETFELPESKTEKADTYEEFNKDLAEAKKTYEARGSLPDFLQKAFEERGQRLEAQFKTPAPGQPAATPAPAATTTAPAKVASAADYANVPSGADYIDPSGVRRKKP